MEKLVWVFTAIILWIVFRHIRKIMENRKCHDDEILNDYFHGRLSRDEELRRQVVSHLGVCEKCQKKMIEMREQ